MMKKRIRFLSAVLALMLLLTVLLSVTAFADPNTRTFTNAAEIYTLVRDGYNSGTKGPISITKGTLKQGLRTQARGYSYKYSDFYRDLGLIVDKK